VSERLERITPHMDLEEALGLILDEVMEQVGAKVAEAIRLCAIPRWFNEEIITWLRGEREPSEPTREIWTALTNLAFVRPYGKRGWAYHRTVRDLLIKHWHREAKGDLKGLSLRMADYYADKDKQERTYHLLAGGSARGFELLKDAISEANTLFQFSTAERLINLTQDPCIDLSQEQERHLQYYTGELLAISGRWDEALPLLDSLQGQALPLPLRARILARLGTIHQRKGHWEESAAFYRRALEIEAQMEPDIRAWTYTGLGILYRKRGEWQLAQDCQESAVKIAEQSGNLLWLGRALNNLGEIHHLQGQLEQARDLYRRSIEIKRQQKDKYGLIWTYINLGALYIDLEDLEQAATFLGQGLQMARDTLSLAEEAWALEYLGELHKRQGRSNLALRTLNQAMAISEEINEVYRKACIQAKLSDLYQDQKDYGQALNYLEQAQETFEHLKSREVDQIEKDLQRVRNQLEQEGK
jgi:tetratricopeptide (TPR) repeat protein